ncbi:hypothetical protein Aduo_002191 [Ancylostoma duodenale]
MDLFHTTRKRNLQLSSATRTQQSPAICNHRQLDGKRSVQTLNHSQNGRDCTTPDKTAKVNRQCVLQIISAMIFNEAEWDYQPITLLLDFGAQKSFMESELSENLKLRKISSRSFTASGVGEKEEVSDSDEVQVTLKSFHSSRKLKKLSIHTKEKLTTTLTTAELSEADLNFISSSNITVAQQSLARTSVSPDLIIGQDLLSTIIDHSSPMPTLRSGLIFTPTVFGHTISGTSRATADVMPSEFHESELGVSATLILPAEYHIEDSDPDHRIASELPSDYGLRFAPLKLEKPDRKFRTIWNRDYLKFRDHLRLVEGCGNSTSCKKKCHQRRRSSDRNFPKIWWN